jgi:hypothetical protein
MSTIMLGVAFLSPFNECHYAKCGFDECHYAECHYDHHCSAECLGALMSLY